MSILKSALFYTPFISLELKNKIFHLVFRRRTWITYKITLRKFLNLCLIGISVLARRRKHLGLPFVLKIDSTPNCQLRCPVCIHGAVGASKDKYDFKNKNMPFDLFMKISSEVAGKASAISFYNLGEPFMNKEILHFVKSANSLGYSTFISSNFSFNFSQKKIKEIVDSGLASLTVCLDGMTQETYGKTRVNGNIEHVKRNLAGVQEYKRAIGSEYPKIEIQYLKYPHNELHVQEAKRFCDSIGIDHFTAYPGETEPWVEFCSTPKEAVKSLPKTFLPKCMWPWVSLVVLWDGEVIPCCGYKYEEAYEINKPRQFKMGNLNNDSLANIWNKEEYQRLRRFILDPGSFGENEAKEIFCYGCPRLYQS